MGWGKSGRLRQPFIRERTGERITRLVRLLAVSGGQLL